MIQRLRSKEGFVGYTKAIIALLCCPPGGRFDDSWEARRA